MPDLARQVVLASASQRRVELLQQFGLQVHQQPADIDESVLACESAPQYTNRLAVSKASALVVSEQQVVLAADTTIDLDGTIIGKPATEAEFRATFAALAGRSHRVWTSVALRNGDQIESRDCCTQVWLRPVSDIEIDAYWRSGEPQGKAGGYAIQGLAAMFVEKIEGSYSNVVGLPLYEVADLLNRHGYPVLNDKLQRSS